jgi:hypothetical protein
MNKKQFMHGLNILHGDYDEYTGIGYKFTSNEIYYLHGVLKKEDGEQFEKDCIEMCKHVSPGHQIDSYVKFVLRNTLGGVDR